MTAIEVTRADILRAIETERDWWRAVFDLAEQPANVTGDEEVNGYWTLRELVDHVNGWRRWTAARLEAASQVGGVPVQPWPEGMSETSMEAVDEINAWFLAESRKTPFVDIRNETFTILDRLRAAVDALSDDRLLRTGACTDIDEELIDYPIGPALIGFSIVHVHGEHAPDLEAWLSQRIGQHAELPPTPSSFGYDE